MERIVKRCAGLDVHKASVTACVRIATGESEESYQETRKFAATTGGLLELRDWLASFEVRLVGMGKPPGPTGSRSTTCWRTTSKLWLLNARHLKNVPARKTDAEDAEWTCRHDRRALAFWACSASLA